MAAVSRFSTQRKILEAAESRIDSAIHDIRQLLQADLFDSEIEAAKELAKKGFLRAAGVVAGVVLESHLGEVCRSHAVVIRKKRATLADYNDALKEASVYEIPTWRALQRLADLRNICGHQRGQEPTADEAKELIDGAEKMTKTVY